MRTALAKHIDTLTRDTFIGFANTVFNCVAEHKVTLSDGSICTAPTGEEYSKVRIFTRSHAGMDANNLNEALRGWRKKNTANPVGTAFQEQQDSGEWLDVVTDRPRFERCVRPMFAMFLRDNAFNIHSPQYVPTKALAPLIKNLKDFFTRELFEKILSKWYGSITVVLSLY